MTPASWVLLAAAAGLAVVAWWAAETRQRPVELVAKPAVIVALMGVALTLQPASEAQRWLFLGGLAASLVGDVALLHSERRSWFAAGLAAFLVAHICYIAGLLVGPGVGGGAALVGLAVGAVAVGLGSRFVGRAILLGVRSGPLPRLAFPVTIYVAVISMLVVVAGATGRPVAFVGALLFYTSDSLLGWDRFVGRLAHRDLLVLGTYHAAQALLVLSLLG